MLRAAYRPLLTLSRCMGRQHTLGKYFEMPKGMKSAPPQQSKLQEMWGKKKAPASASNIADSSVKQSSDSKAKLEDEKKEDTEMAEAVEVPEVKRSINNGKRKQGAEASSTAERPARKKRIVESDSDENAVHPPSSSRASSPPNDKLESSPPPTTTKLTATSKSRRGKAKVIEEDDDDVALPAEDEEGATSAEEPVEEEGEDLDEDLGEVNTKIAAKNANAAMSKIDEVDLPNGWKTGEPVPYAALAKVFGLIEATTKRLEKTALLTAFLLLVIRRSNKGDPTSLLQSVYLCINRLSPDYVGIELGIGESLLIKAISNSTGRSVATIKVDLKKEGDLGLVAQHSKSAQKTLFKPKPLTVPFVFNNLKEIALSTGHSSQTKKVQIISKLLAACQDQEAKYIVRSLEGKLRIGNAERTVVLSLAHAAVFAEKEKSDKRWSPEKLTARLLEGGDIIKSVYSELPSYEEIIPSLLKDGIDGVKEACKLTPGVPLKPMLAKPTKAIGEVLDRFEGKRFTCEYKYDGERAQVHRLPDGTVGVFSRNSEDMSKKYPDLVEQLPHCIKDNTNSFVLDAEAVAIDKDTGKLMPFQELSKRKRKDVKVEDIQVRVCLFAFDLIYLNGESLLRKSLIERRALLLEHFQPVDKEFQFAKASDGESTEEIQTFLDDSVKDGCEGLMVKMLETDASYYEPSRRSINWLKLKKDYLAGVGDSLDLVVVGAYFGKGKRTNVYGAFLLACYDADGEEFQTVCKIGTGFSEEALQTHYDTLYPFEATNPRGDIKAGGAKPDVWFEPKVVWEVLAADLSLSPIYTAGHGLVDERGISLRFPRFIRIRDDKGADDATNSEQIAEMYEKQALAAGGKKQKKGAADDDFW